MAEAECAELVMVRKALDSFDPEGSTLGCKEGVTQDHRHLHHVSYHCHLQAPLAVGSAP